MKNSSTSPNTTKSEVLESRVSLAWRSLRLIDIASTIQRALGLPHNDPGLIDDGLLSNERRQRLIEQSRAIRGPVKHPSVFIFGVQPRSGTNLAANLVALHPDIESYPRQMFEMPLLRAAQGTRAFRNELLSYFPRNAGSIDEWDPLLWMAGGMMRALVSDTGDRPLLFKSPHMQFVHLFSVLFPDDVCVLVVRDGRDIIASSMKTFHKEWFSKSFRQMAREWHLATNAAMKIAAEDTTGRVLLWRFEDLASDPRATLERDLVKLGLDETRFPYEKLETLPVFGSSTSEKEGKERWRPVEREKSFNPIGRWQDWSERKQRAFMREAGATLTRAGYV